MHMCVSVCVHKCASVHVNVSMLAHVCMDMWRPGVNLLYHFSCVIIVSFETGYLLSGKLLLSCQTGGQLGMENCRRCLLWVLGRGMLELLLKIKKIFILELGSWLSGKEPWLLL